MLDPTKDINVKKVFFYSHMIVPFRLTYLSPYLLSRNLTVGQLTTVSYTRHSEISKQHKQ